MVSQPLCTAEGSGGEANGGLEIIKAITVVEDRVYRDSGGCGMQHAIKCHQAYMLCHSRAPQH